jgi:hypothetical protein
MEQSPYRVDYSWLRNSPALRPVTHRDDKANDLVHAMGSWVCSPARYDLTENALEKDSELVEFDGLIKAALW